MPVDPRPQARFAGAQNQIGAVLEPWEPNASLSTGFDLKLGPYCILVICGVAQIFRVQRTRFIDRFFDLPSTNAIDKALVRIFPWQLGNPYPLAAKALYDLGDGLISRCEIGRASCRDRVCQYV